MCRLGIRLRGLPPVVLLAALAGCGKAFLAAPVDRTTGEDAAALYYYLPEDVVEVIVTLERTTTRKLEKDPSGVIKVVSQENVEPVGATITLQTVPDTAAAFLLDSDATGFSKNKSAFTVTDTGLLQAVNVSTVGVGGVVFERVMDIAGTLLPLVNLPNKRALGVADLDAATDVNAPGNFREQSLMFTRPRGIAGPPAPRTTCDEQILRTQYLPRTLQVDFAFQEGKIPNRQQLVAEFCNTLGAIEARRESYQETLEEFDGANDAAAITRLNRKLTRLREEYEIAVTRHVDSRAAIIAAVQQAVTAAGVSEKTERYTLRSVFHMSQLPTVTVAETLQPKSAGNFLAITVPPKTDVDPEVLELFSSTGILITADQIGTPPTGHPGLAACRDGDRDSPCIYYRSPSPYLLSAWTSKPPTMGGELSLVQSDSKIVDVIGDRSPTLAIELRESGFTKRDTTLGFTPRGRLTAVARDDGSAAESASTSIANGLSGGLTRYQAALTATKSIRTLEGEIELLPLQQQLSLANANASLELQPVQAQLAMAQQQLSLLNANTSLDVATQGQATVLATQLSNLQNALATAQQQLLNTQASAQRTDQQAALVANTSMLAAQIAQLQNEVQLREIRRRLAELEATP
jgi:hypothetical protein